MKSDESDVLYLLAYVLMQNARPEKAAVLLDALDTLEPGRAQTLQALATAQIRAGRAATALSTLDRLAMSGGAGALFHLLRSQALGALGRPDESAEAMRTYLQLREPEGTQAVPH